MIGAASRRADWRRLYALLPSAEKPETADASPWTRCAEKGRRPNGVMDTRQLRSFLALARTGSFSRAAIMLNVAQPMLSRQIRALEAHVGIQLFYRNGRGVVLTEAGLLLQQHAEGIVGSISDAESALKAMTETPTGEVLFGLPPMIGSILTVPVITAFKKRYPGVSLRIVEAFSGYILEWLASARLDVAVLYNVTRSSFIVTEPLVDEEVWLVAAPSLNLRVDKAGMRLADLHRVPLILPNQPHGLRTLVESQLAKIGMRPNIALEVDGMSALLRLTEHGFAAAILSRGMALRLRDQGRLQAWPIVDPVIKAPLCLATSTQRPSTPVTRALAQIVRAEARALSEGWTTCPSFPCGPGEAAK